MTLPKPRFDKSTFAKELTPLSGVECRINAFQKILSHEERLSFKHALLDPTITISAIFKVAKQFGYKGATTSLYQHRRDPGSCLRCERAKFLMGVKE